MPLYQAVVLAIVQGLTEFLPISSTAHLTLFPWLFGWEDPGLTFDVALHAGTLVAVFVYFWKMWVDMLLAVAGIGGSDPAKVRQERTLFWYLVIGTIPGGIAGWLFENAAETRLRSPFIIAAALIVVGLLMWWGDHLTSNSRGLQEINLRDAAMVGISQAFAVIPGVSRSGSTMTSGLFCGMKRETAARFSFLLSTPIIAGAALKKGLEMYHEGIPPALRIPLIVGVIVSAIVGYVVIAALMRYLERRTFKIFVVYRLALGVIVLLLGWGLRHA
ncbi:MAG TPA: undecaprenyl-diphosphatase UppP [Terriglobia bacterium]|nr:undecaprenyl-diphosphatase UppP [Terriglobia bacterium]